MGGKVVLVLEIVKLRGIIEFWKIRVDEYFFKFDLWVRLIRYVNNKSFCVFSDRVMNILCK